MLSRVSEKVVGPNRRRAARSVSGVEVRGNLELFYARARLPLSHRRGSPSLVAPRSQSARLRLHVTPFKGTLIGQAVDD